ncbi:hypothetical protein GE107_01615 [Cohnella sp. CFH 77786]|uniref:hypothetical protein n=1 Tax=Cohnella sp. CFH 77786 TaxID=2662265 RepID=UPI001C609C80|nr:hypothetical protein [Cohnella sp. CFH 77786]MBW5444763.1 hypothetical protein [Cohnella sp. CFH 77786]
MTIANDNERSLVNEFIQTASKEELQQLLQGLLATNDPDLARFVTALEKLISSIKESMIKGTVSAKR